MSDIDFSEELAAIRDYLSAAQEVLKSGYMPDIASLESRVALVCDALQQLPREVQKDHVASLSSVLQQINILETGMRTFHESRMKSVTGNA